MRSLILTLSLLIAGPTMASVDTLKELCALDSFHDEEQAYEKNFTETDTLDIRKVQSLSEKELNMVNAYLIGEDFTTQALSFPEIQALFVGDGDLAYNDLHLITFKSNSSGLVYTQILSWPGDNPVGLIFDRLTGKAVAHNSDDSISLLAEKGEIWCGDLK
ncbi:hypothetical protein ACES2I_05200 [Bdellovibrio bacteriovorus]|uniref:hypothetical protein n=1 Tax=Bdellovibrio bacteriovorus TaxID=959 RepID=UPI0035A6AF95